MSDKYVVESLTHWKPVRVGLREEYVKYCATDKPCLDKFYNTTAEDYICRARKTNCRHAIPRISGKLEDLRRTGE